MSSTRRRHNAWWFTYTYVCQSIGIKPCKYADDVFHLCNYLIPDPYVYIYIYIYIATLCSKIDTYSSYKLIMIIITNDISIPAVMVGGGGKVTTLGGNVC